MNTLSQPLCIANKDIQFMGWTSAPKRTEFECHFHLKQFGPCTKDIFNEQKHDF